jgi:hypothetical protein
MRKLSTSAWLRIAVYFVLLSLLLFSMAGLWTKDSFYDYFSKFDGVKFCYIYNCSNDEINATNKSLLPAHIVKNGHYLFVYSNDNFYKDVKFKQGKISGDINRYISIVSALNLRNCCTKKEGGIIATYGFASEFGEFRWVDNKKVNLHIVFSNGEITFGSPLIYGSY